MRRELADLAAGQGRLAAAALSGGRGRPACWRPQKPWHRLYVDVGKRHGNGNAAKSAVARKILIAVWHVWSLQQPFKLAVACAAPIVPASSGHCGPVFAPISPCPYETVCIL